MNKSVLVYVVVFVVTSAVLFGILYLFLADDDTKSVDQETPAGEIEATAQAALDDSTAAGDSTAAEKERFIFPDSSEVDTLVYQDPEVPDPLVEYQNLSLLRNKLIEFYAGDRITVFSPTEIDSILKTMVFEIDSLAYRQMQYVRKINEMERTANSKDRKIERLQSTIESLKLELSDIKTARGRQQDEEFSEQYEKKIKDLADTFNSMRPKEVAGALMALSDDEIVAVLKKMNQRKSGKVLAELPYARKAKIVRKMIE